MAHNWLNNTARELNGKIYSQHGLKEQRRKLRQQWIDKGLDRKITFNEFLKTSRPKHKRIYDSNNGRHFTHGKYAGEYIGKIARYYPEYIEWILVNRPDSNLGKEILAFFNKYKNFKI